MAKQKNNNANGPSFADAIESTLPDMGQLESAFAAPTSAARRVPGTRTVPASDPNNPYGVPYEMFDFRYNHDVYVIYRPWHTCRRCNDEMAKGAVTMPEDGDYTCPHTRRAAYLAQMQRFLSDGHLRLGQREETLMDGSIQVSVSWMVPQLDEKKLAEAKKKSQERTSEDPA